MSRRLRLYTRRDCCLCEEMKAVVQSLARELPLELDEIDVDSDAALAAEFGAEVPVLFIDDRKAFKFRVSVVELRKRLRR